MGKAPPGRGRQWSMVNSRARPNGDPFGVEGMGPLGGRVGLAFGEPLRRWSQGIFFGRWDQVPHGLVQEGGRRRVLRRLTHHQPCGWSPALAKGGYTLGLTAHCFQYKQPIAIQENEGPCSFYPPFSRAGVSMRSMGGGLAAPRGCVSLQAPLPPAKGLHQRKTCRPSGRHPTEPPPSPPGAPGRPGWPG